MSLGEWRIVTATNITINNQPLNILLWHLIQLRPQHSNVRFDEHRAVMWAIACSRAW